MSKITFQFVRVEPIIDRTSGHVISWVIGLKGTGDTGAWAYIDDTVAVSPDKQKPLAAWTEDEIMAFCLARASLREEGERNWYERLKAQIEEAEAAPVKGEPVQLNQTMRWRGEYRDDMEYSADDIVEDGGTAYMALAPAKNQRPPGDKWREIGPIRREEVGKRG